LFALRRKLPVGKKLHKRTRWRLLLKVELNSH
jgi:hypothetical protein